MEEFHLVISCKTQPLLNMLSMFLPLLYTLSIFFPSCCMVHLSTSISSLVSGFCIHSHSYACRFEGEYHIVPVPVVVRLSFFSLVKFLLFSIRVAFINLL